MLESFCCRLLCRIEARVCASCLSSAAFSGLGGIGGAATDCLGMSSVKGSSSKSGAAERVLGLEAGLAGWEPRHSGAADIAPAFAIDAEVEDARPCAPVETPVTTS